ncbi:cytidine/deoxycytidylate deaminase family protein [Lederbergia citrisecunda]|uniref:deoxycytidylate deaminase n=1 Tax=Lederbergia citrisecunda TaxID=2833583 RepID=UPI003D26C7B6
MNEAQEKNRKTWDEYFMSIAKTVATRATCDRLHVGCVIVKGKKILSTGYNGSISGSDHCDDVGHLYNNEGRCIRTVHAEQNAILHTSEKLTGATAYVTHYPCENCAKLLVQSGVVRVVYANKYKNEYSDFFLNMIETTYLEDSH